jgi:X-X-X-Leu-X-X-Gly heptad repeat protein
MTPLTRRTAAATALLILTCTVAPGAAASAAPTDSLTVTNHETVTVRVDATGTQVSAHLVDVLAATGTGEAQVHNPSATDDLRNLLGYRRPATDGDDLVQTVAAGQRLATEATVTGSVPVTLHAQYELDGTTLSPADLRGRSGKLTITYTVTNRSAEDTKLTYTDADGKSHTVTEKVFTPLVGDLVAELPTRYRNVTADGGTVSGTATGGTHVAYNLVLAPPMGNPQLTVTLTADVTDAEIPAAVMQLIPATTGTDPASGFAEQTFASTNEANAKLAEGAGAVDDQVVSLQSGIASLADGLTQLAAGADTLQKQLNGQLVPGAEAAADGAAKTSDGAGKLAEGTGEIASSADALSAGTQQLSAGLAQLDTALGQLSGAGGMSATLAAAQALRSAVQQIVAQLGAANDPDTLLGALNTLASGAGTLNQNLASAADSAAAIAKGVGAGADRTDALSDTVSDVATLVSNVINADCAPGGPLSAEDCADLRKAQKQSTQGAAGIDALGDELTEAATALQSLSRGLGQAEKAAADLSHGIATTAAGLQQITVALSNPDGGADATKGVVQGLDALVAGLAQQIHGITTLASAANSTSAAADQINDGAGQLAAGSAHAADSAEALEKGAGQVAEGSAQVAEGVQAGADGAAEIAGQTGKSADGAKNAADGAEQLHEDGSAELTRSIVDGSATPAQVSAIFTAMDQRAAQALPFGVPEGATGSVMWKFEMDPSAAADPAGTPHDGPADGTRILLALAMLLICAATAGVIQRWPAADRAHG